MSLWTSKSFFERRRLTESQLFIGPSPRPSMRTCVGPSWTKSPFLVRRSPAMTSWTPCSRHLSAVVSGGTKFATRRAILVVPHRIVAGEDLSPLGLVSVRLIPRFVGEVIRILYSFTWRTVEAFVGFPYSLYGSVGFAEHLTAELQARVATEQRRHVRMGEVSYIAHSLHMFMDAYGQNIARRIVDDASK